MYFVNTFDVCIKHCSKMFPKLKVLLFFFGALYAMEFLMTHFKDLASMAKLVPQEECPHLVQKSNLMKDEKYTDDTIDN